MKDKRKLRILTSLVVVCIGMAALVLNGLTLSWFVNNWTGKGNITFNTGTNNVPDAKVWKYFTEEEVSTSEDLGWKEAELTHPENRSDVLVFPGVKSNVETVEGKNVTTFDISSLQCGNIDNLVKVGDDNAIYFMFLMDIDEYGNTVELEIEYDDEIDFVHVYDHDGATVNDSTILGDMKNLCTENNGIYAPIRFAYAPLYVQDDNDTDTVDYYVPGTDDFDTLVFKDYNTDPITLSPNNKNDSVYLYVKLFANLDSFAQASEILHDVMPCIITFDIIFTMTVYPLVTTGE